MLQISDWSTETKPDGTAKDVAYIDGGIMETSILELNWHSLLRNTISKVGVMGSRM